MSESYQRFKEWKPPKIEHNKLTKWNWMVGHPEGLKLGKSVDIGAFTYINAQFGVEIGDNAQIGSHCSIYSADTEREIYKPVKIGAGARIGCHSTLLPGSIVEDNEFVPGYSIVTGNRRLRLVR